MTPALHRLPILAALAAAACVGSQSPPPPVATPTPGGVLGDLRPMSSRETAAPAPATVASTLPPAAEAALPPGHPPIEGAAGSADAVGLPSGHPAIEGGPVAVGPLGALARSTHGITGTIVLSPTLLGRVASTDVLYIMARKGSATIAVRREEKVSLPFAFEISGGDAMVAGTVLEGPVDVVARLSKTGDAIPSKGDLEGVTRSVGVPARDVTVTIDRVRE